MQLSHTLTTLLSLASLAAAHGWVGTIAFSGKSYKGNEPTQEQPSAFASPIRQIADNLPVKDVTSAELTCGRDATPASQVATVAAGSKVEVSWKTLAEGGLWFHDVGPMQAYLADCGSQGCADFDAKSAKWFKIDEQGLLGDGTWAQAKLDTGAPAEFTLPSNLKAGNYLLRHEIIALHTAQSEGGAEFYIGCTQLKVTGSGTGAPKSSELVSIPGAYSASAPGILIDVYNMKSAYKFPGPAVASFVSGSDSNSGSSSSSDDGDDSSSSPASSTHKATSPTTTVASSPAQPTSGSTSGSKTCSPRSRRRAAARAAAAAARNVTESRSNPESEEPPVLRKAARQVHSDVRRWRMRSMHAARGSRL